MVGNDDFSFGHSPKTKKILKNIILTTMSANITLEYLLMIKKGFYLKSRQFLQEIIFLLEI